MKILFQLFLLMTYSFVIASTGDKKNSSYETDTLTTDVKAENSLRISGYVTLNGGHKYEAVVRLYRNNDEVALRPTEKGGKFEFYLLPDYYYTIEVMKKGYVTNRIVINTKEPGYFSSPKHIEFDVDLMKAEKKNRADNPIMELPVAIIRYNSKKEAFDYNNQYTIYYLMEIEKMRDVPFLLRWIEMAEKR